MSTILVTGASGAFGSHLASRLLDEGHEVISFKHDERPVTTAKLLGIEDQITWVRGSITDERLCKRVIADFEVDSIFHLAALPIVQVGTRTTQPIFETNFGGTINLLEAVRENTWAGKHVRFIYVSTDKVYGDAGGKPYTEDMPLNGLGIYECSKAAADLAARTYANAGFAPKLVIARPCNLILPGDLNFGRVLPRMIIPCLRGDSPTLYRTSYLREFMDVRDAVEALIELDEALVRDDVETGGAFNVGSGEQRTLDQVVAAVMKHFPKIEPKWTEAPAISRIEIPFQTLSTDKIQHVLGWKAKYTFEQSIDHLVKWWRDVYPVLPHAIRNTRIEDWHGGTSSSPVAATRRRVKVEVECSACGGRGQLNCGSLGTVDCEVCHGRGKHSSVD